MHPYLQKKEKANLKHTSDPIEPQRLAETSALDAETTDDGEALKKKFVEPELSNPVNVLEATTFFQVSTSGATN